MCGIVGIISKQKEAVEENIERATQALAHRGPDDWGTVVLKVRDYWVGLGHRRLSIIDLSSAGRQPMSNEDGTVWIVYNGETYNFPEIRANLRLRHRFKSNTDAEVVLHLYEEKGEEFVSDLNGMFGMALVDVSRGRIFLARDRLGIKPLYYAFYGGHFLFASEIKAILTTGLVPKKVNWQAIWDYFTFLFVPHPLTAFEHICQMPPAHIACFDLERDSFLLQKYWEPSVERMLDETAAGELIRSLLSDAVAKRLISDVPLGVFLSGGIDSSVITGLMAAHSSRPVKTFTVIFKGEGMGFYDERDRADRVRRAFSTDHTEIETQVSPSYEEILGLIKFFDQPFANPTFYLAYLLSKETRKHVTVALCGAGGDELFGGYPRYRILPLAQRLQLVPKAANKIVTKLALWRGESFETPFARRLRLAARGFGYPFPRQYLRWTYFFDEEEKRNLLAPLAHGRNFAPSVRIVEGHMQTAERLGFYDPLRQAQYADLKLFLADNILEYTDKMSMAVALEVRVPFLDHRVVEASFAIPFKQKIGLKSTKIILKKALKDFIPSDNLKGPKKGFCPPLALWMFALDRYFDEKMPFRRVKSEGVFDWSYIQRLREEHKSKQRDNSMELFGIMVFDAWFRAYII